MPKAIVTAAITGSIHIPTMTPHLPITPKQIADEAVRACEAGAAVAHIHVRNPETGQPMASMDLFREIITDVKSRCDMVLCLTTGGGLGMTTEQRVAVVPTFRPELASFNFGSMNFGLFPLLSRFDEYNNDWEPGYLEMTEDFVFTNQIGAPLKATELPRQEMRPLLKMAGLSERLRFHDLRHTAISLALANNTAPTDVMQMAGHSSVALTLSRYAHAMPGAESRATDAIDAALTGV